MARALLSQATPVCEQNMCAVLFWQSWRLANYATLEESAETVFSPKCLGRRVPCTMRIVLSVFRLHRLLLCVWAPFKT